jgi:hypothetical protein
MKNVRFLSFEEYCSLPTGDRDSTLNANYPSVVDALKGIKGFKDNFFVNSPGSEFPDDPYKCDIAFGLKDEDTGAIIQVWNYKNGPVYNQDENITLNDIPEFSVHFVNKEGTLLLQNLQHACDKN